MCEVIAICNQKGGVGKTTTAMNLSAGLVKKGKRVLVIDLDSQANYTNYMGYDNPDELPLTIPDLLELLINRKEIPPKEDYILSKDGVDFIPAAINLGTLEVYMVNVIGREQKLKTFLNPLKEFYDYILIDCMPYLGVLTVNALVAADKVIIPMQAEYFSYKGVEALVSTIYLIKQELNPALIIEGIVLTMVNNTKNTKNIINEINETAGKYIKIFNSMIPRSVKVSESTTENKNIFDFSPTNPVSIAYMNLCEEVLNDVNP